MTGSAVCSRATRASAPPSAGVIGSIGMEFWWLQAITVNPNEEKDNARHHLVASRCANRGYRGFAPSRVSALTNLPLNINIIRVEL